MKIRTSRRQTRGFTLIESLTVIVILGMLVAFATPTMLSAIKATRLTSAGEQLTGKLLEAQGLAITFSSDVELRIYKAPVEKPADGTSGQFLQLFQWVENEPDLDPDADAGVASLKQVGPRESLPEGVAISDNLDFSTLWNLNTQVEEDAEKGNLEYVAIRFRPDGSTNLSETASWHLTLVDNQTSASTEVPANFYTLQIDPVTGKLETFRPD